MPERAELGLSRGENCLEAAAFTHPAFLRRVRCSELRRARLDLGTLGDCTLNGHTAAAWRGVECRELFEAGREAGEWPLAGGTAALIN